ncbi:DMT family transporter [Flavobacterium terrae]|uniref:Guanidinium exporter n=1 Tax=Flavobacterium terrae TaxID=415425 RepID=A0A1M6BR05_9FLAO|nr:multidrug efflux SMR transporter [Flavobacterium terrae]SHI51159.1 quaternary ammonium compound-resistance protein SugE [Flavobacterium terrae]
MSWILLIIAGFFEVAFATCLGKAKETSGQTMWLWYLGFLVCLTISMVLLVKVTKDIPIGTAYAVWTGIGAVGSVLIGIFIFKEPATFWRIFFLMALIASIVGLKYVSE